MSKKRTIICIILTAVVLLGGGFFLGRYICPNQIIQPQFQTFSTDSLGVYRLVDTDHYISADKKLKVDISYIQLGESDSFYQMKLSTESEPYYGHMFYAADGTTTGNFCSPSSPNPIRFYDGHLDDTYIIINNKKIKLTLIQQEQ